MDDLIQDSDVAAGYTALLYRYYQKHYGISMYDAPTLARLYNGGPAAINGATGDLNAIYAEDVGSLVTQLESGMDGHKIRELINSGRISAPSQ